MLALRHFPILTVLALMALILIPGRAQAQLAADGTPPISGQTKTAPAAAPKDQPRPQKPGAPMGSGAKDESLPSPAGVVHPAQAFPPERILRPDAVAPLPDAKPAPKDDPRGIEEGKDVPEADR